MKCKIFCVELDQSPTPIGELEQNVNTWLASQTAEIKTTHVVQTVGDNAIVLTLFYSEQNC